MVINKFPNREVYEKIKAKGSLGANDVNVLENYPGLEWKGEYSSTATYVKGDIVYYENMLYVMISASVIGAIPGIDNDWIDFAKRSVTSSDVTNALGFTPADSTKVLPLSGGTLTGNLTGKYIIGTWLQATDAGHLATTPTKIPVFDDKGWIYYRTPAEILKDIGASSGYTLTEADKTEIAGKVVADGTEFTLSDFPTALKNPNALTFTGAATGTYDGSAALTVNIPSGGSSGSGGALKAMSAVSGYIGIPAADLPENGVSLDASQGELTVGGSVTLVATVQPSDATNPAVTWSSSAPTVASVANGVVTALAAGTAVITATTVDGGHTASYNLTVKAAAVDLIATYGAIDNIRLSTGSGTEKAAEGYVTVGHNAPIDVSKQTYPNGAIIRVTGAVNCKGNDWSTTPNGGDSAWSMYTNAAGTAYSHSDYITDKTGTIGPITLDADKTGFTVDLASLDKRWIKFCVKGTAANLTATLTPK